MQNIKVDISLSDVDTEIETLKSDLAFKIKLRDWLKEKSVSGKHAIPTNEKKSIKPTPFIESYLADGKHNRVQIITAYAKAVGRKYEEVENNVSNALTRLKKAGKVSSKKEKGNGSVWQLKKIRMVVISGHPQDTEIE